jgi:hypothetical protein
VLLQAKEHAVEGCRAVRVARAEDRPQSVEPQDARHLALGEMQRHVLTRALVAKTHGQVPRAVVEQIGLELVQLRVGLGRRVAARGTQHGRVAPQPLKHLELAWLNELLVVHVRDSRIDVGRRERCWRRRRRWKHGHSLLVKPNVVEAEHAGVLLLGPYAELLAKANVKVTEAAQNERRAWVGKARESHGRRVQDLGEVLIQLGAASVEKRRRPMAPEKRAASVATRRRDIAHVERELASQLHVETLELGKRAVQSPRRLELLGAELLALEHNLGRDEELGVFHNRRVELEAVHLDRDAEDRRDVMDGDA